MKIKNVSSSIMTIPEIKDDQGAGLVLSPGAEVIIYDEDAEKSPTLASYLSAGYALKTGDEEPGDSTGVADVDIAALKARVDAGEAAIVALTETVATQQLTIDNLIARVEDLESS